LVIQETTNWLQESYALPFSAKVQSMHQLQPICVLVTNVYFYHNHNTSHSVSLLKQQFYNETKWSKFNEPIHEAQYF